MRNPYFQTPPVVKNLVIANCVLYLAVRLIPAVNHFCAEYLQLWWTNSPYNPEFHSYQFVTYMFLHAGFGHLFSNMFALWMFGRTLEYELGSQRFLTYYMVCGIGAALIQIGVASLFGENLNVAEMNTIVGYVYDMLYGDSGGYPSFASAAAIILFVIVLTITCINLLVSKKKVHY